MAYLSLTGLYVSKFEDTNKKLVIYGENDSWACHSQKIKLLIRREAKLQLTF